MIGNPSSGTAALRVIWFRHTRPRLLLLQSLTEASQRLRAALLALDETKLTEPLPDEQMRDVLPTKGHALLQVIAAHTAYHAGQLAVWRRAIGRQSAGVFI